MVILAGLATWVDAHDSGRIGMGVTTILTISTLIQGLKSSLPKVSYLTILDIYLWACFFFVFSTTGYCCCINYLMTAHQDHELVQNKIRVQKRRNGRLSINQIRSPIIDDHVDYTDDYCFDKDTKLSTNSRRRSSLAEKIKISMNRISYKKYESKRRRMWRTFIRTLYTSKIRTIDSHFRLYYYVSFLTFNLIYWVFVIVITQHDTGAEANE